MDANGKDFSFRRSMRGFNKDDVIKYISEENKRFMAEKSLLEGKLTEAEWTINDGNRKADEMKNSFDAILDAKNKEISDFKSETDKLKSDLANSNSRQVELTDECTQLRTVINGCEEQLQNYSGRIADLEAENAILSAKANSSDDLKAENEYLREKYKVLELEFRTLADKLREIENAPVQYQSPRESKEDPFQKRSNDIYANKNNSTGAGETPSAYRKNTTTRSSSEDARQISNKAINSIKAIHDDVQTYMNNCVGEFDLYSKDIIESITRLVAEIEQRCTLLQNKLAMHKQVTDKCIDRRYNGYGSEF